MATIRRLSSSEATGSGDVSIAEAIAEYLRWLSTKRGRSGRVTSPQTLGSYASALPVTFAGVGAVAALAEEGAERLRANIRDAWGGMAPSTFNVKRAAVASALSYFQHEGWLPHDVDPLVGLGREFEPKPVDRVCDRAAIDRLIASKQNPLRDRALFSMLYSTAARCEEALALDVSDLDPANRRAHTVRKGGRPDELMYDLRTGRLLEQMFGSRTCGPLLLSDRTHRDGRVPLADIDPASGCRRMTYRTAARRLSTASGGWSPYDLRDSRLTHAGEDGLTEAVLMNLSGHEYRRTLQRLPQPL